MITACVRRIIICWNALEHMMSWFIETGCDFDLLSLSTIAWCFNVVAHRTFYLSVQIVMLIYFPYSYKLSYYKYIGQTVPGEVLWQYLCNEKAEEVWNGQQGSGKVNNLNFVIEIL